MLSPASNGSSSFPANPVPWLLPQNTQCPTVSLLMIDTNRARGICLFEKVHRKVYKQEEDGNVEDTEFFPQTSGYILWIGVLLGMFYFIILIIIFKLLKNVNQYVWRAQSKNFFFLFFFFP